MIRDNRQAVLYNFLVTGEKGAWNHSAYEFTSGRFLEYTAEHLAASFQPLTAKRIALLLELPCLFAYEGKDSPMCIGRLLGVEQRSTVLRIRFELDRELPVVPFEQIEALRIDLDIRDWELNRTHWAVKEADLLGTLNDAGVLARPRSSAGASVEL